MKHPLFLILFAAGVISSLPAYSQMEYVVDLSFQAGAGATSAPDNFSAVKMARSQPDGKVFICGSFSFYNGTPVKKLARLNTDGTLDETFAIQGTGFDGFLYDFAIQPDGKIIVVGNFHSYNGTTKHHVVRLNSNGVLDDTFDAGDAFSGTAVDGARCVALQSDGKIIVGGASTVGSGPPARAYVKRLLSTGAIDGSFTIAEAWNDIEMYSEVTRIAIQPDNKVLVGGGFTMYSAFNSQTGTNRRGIFRLNENGTFDPDFTLPSNLDYRTFDIARGPDGSFYRASFDLRKLTSSGSVDVSFQPDPIVYGTLALAFKDDKVLVGGFDKIYTLNADGSLDQDQTVILEGTIASIIVLDDDQLLVAGNFRSMAGTAINNIARLYMREKQIITFEAPGPKAIGDEPFELIASSSAEKPITFTSSDESVVTIDGNIATIVGGGTTTLTAYADGDETIGAAMKSHELVVSKLSNEIAFEEIGARLIDEGSITLEANATSELVVTFTSGSNKIDLAGDEVTLLSPGEVTITAEQAGNSIFEVATPVDQTFCINPSTPIMTLSPDADVTLISSNNAGNQWMNDGVAIEGANTKTFKPTSSGIYSVVTIIDGCSSVASESRVVTILGFEDTMVDELKIFQNPVTDHLVLEISSETRQEINVDVIDMLGRTVVSQPVRANHVSTIEMTHAAEGMYIVRALGQRVRVLKK